MPELRGPKTPFPLRVPKLILRPLEYLEDYRRQYGDLFSVGDAAAPLVYVADPKVIQTIFQADAAQFEIPSQGIGGILTFLLGDQSLILLDGERHKRHRRLLMPPFHGDRMRSYGQLICDLTQQVTSTWTPGTTVRLRDAMQDITLRVILQAVFGLNEGPRYDRLRHLLGTLLEGLATPVSAVFIFFRVLQQDWGPLSPWGRFVRLKGQVDELIYAEIQDRRARQDCSGSDILTLMMVARDDQGEPMTDAELHDELITLLIAGHETTASALCWAFYWIHAQPQVGATLRAELDGQGPNPEPLTIAQLPYLNAVCQETLRIYPITLTTGIRILKQPMTLAGYELPAGTTLFPSMYLVHHASDLYPNPKIFRPERFLERQFSSYEFFPFGGGHRSCIGMAFALMEMKLVLATVLQHWDLDLVSRRPVKPVRRGLTMAPPSGLKFRVLGQRQPTPADASSPQPVSTAS